MQDKYLLDMYDGTLKNQIDTIVYKYGSLYQYGISI